MFSNASMPDLLIRSYAKWTQKLHSPRIVNRRKGGKKQLLDLLGLKFLAAGLFVLMVVVGVKSLRSELEETGGADGLLEGSEPTVVGQTDVGVRGEIPLKSRMMTPGGHEVQDEEEEGYFVETPITTGNESAVLVTSCPPSQPQVKVYPNYVPWGEFETFKEDLIASADISDKSLLESNFGYTKGWMIRFNTEGIQQMKSHPQYGVAARYFDMARNPEANAFVINLLICNQPPEGEHAVKYHLDNSVAVKASIVRDHLFVAHQVNVLYLDIPDGMKGGQLEVWPLGHEFTEEHKSVVTPAANLMAEFRGDSFHRVGAITLPKGKSRVGIVLEQYKVAKKYYPYSIPFCAGDQCEKLQLEP